MFTNNLELIFEFILDSNLTCVYFKNFQVCLKIVKPNFELNYKQEIFYLEHQVR